MMSIVNCAPTVERSIDGASHRCQCSGSQAGPCLLSKIRNVRLGRRQLAQETLPLAGYRRGISVVALPSGVRVGGLVLGAHSYSVLRTPGRIESSTPGRIESRGRDPHHHTTMPHHQATMQHHHATMQHTPCSPQTVPHPHDIAIPSRPDRLSLSHAIYPHPHHLPPHPSRRTHALSEHHPPSHATPMPYPCHPSTVPSMMRTTRHSRAHAADALLVYRAARFAITFTITFIITSTRSTTTSGPSRPGKTPLGSVVPPRGKNAQPADSAVCGPFLGVAQPADQPSAGGGVSNVHGVQQPGARAPRLSELARVRPPLPPPFRLSHHHHHHLVHSRQVCCCSQVWRQQPSSLHLRTTRPARSERAQRARTASTRTEHAHRARAPSTRRTRRPAPNAWKQRHRRPAMPPTATPQQHTSPPFSRRPPPRSSPPSLTAAPRCASSGPRVNAAASTGPLWAPADAPQT